MGIAKLKNFSLSFEVDQPALSVENALQIAQSLNFGPLANLLVKEGTYTPNNDYFWLWQNIPTLEAPNFFYIQTDGVVNLSVTGGGVQMLNAVPINKMHLLLLPPNSPYAPTTIYLEGRLGYPSPMAQGFPVNYLAIMAQVDF